jgi:hypothetical protein
LASAADAARADELKQAQTAYANANADFYQAIRFKEMSPQQMSHLEGQITGPAVSQQHRAFESAIENSFASYGLKPGDPERVLAAEPDANERWTDTAPSRKEPQRRPGKIAAEPSAGEPVAPPRAEDRSPVRYDKSGVEKTVRFGVPAQPVR